MNYQPRSSGFVGGAGVKWRPRRKRYDRPDWEDILLSDVSRIRAEVPDYDEHTIYNEQQLKLITEKILLNDPKPVQDHPQVLLADHYKRRAKREIYVSAGTPDPSIVSGLYWRVHPQGRRRNSDEQRKKNGASYYR